MRYLVLALAFALAGCMTAGQPQVSVDTATSARDARLAAAIARACGVQPTASAVIRASLTLSGQAEFLPVEAIAARLARARFCR
jgi:hypothetical protein